MANIVYAKTGLSIPKVMFGRDGFDKGFDDDIRFLINVSYNNPADTFYIVGNNSFDEIHPLVRKRLFPYNNVINAYDFKKYGSNKFLDVTENENMRYKIPMEYFNDNSIVVDYGIIALGPVLDRNIYMASKLPDGEWAQPLARGKNYIAPIIHTLNETGIRWVALCDDPRCMKGAFDWFNTPPIVLSQVNDTMSSEHITSYDDTTLITSEIEVKYAHVESTVVMDEKVRRVDDSWKDRSNYLSMALNGGSNKESIVWDDEQKVFVSDIPEGRYTFLRETVLDKFDDCEIYGRWGDDLGEKDGRFRGTVARSKLYKLMLDWKHSFCIPIREKWATSKYLEYLKCGVSPFLYYTYDDEKNTKLQDFYRVGKDDDLRDVIEGSSEDQHIEELNKAIDTCLGDKFTTGQYLNDEVYYHLGIERNITNVNRELWEVEIGSETTGLSGFFE